MKKILCIGVAAVLALGIVSLSGCGKKETPVETEATTTTTEATTTTETTVPTPSESASSEQSAAPAAGDSAALPFCAFAGRDAGGGVAANPVLRAAYEKLCASMGVKLVMPPLSSCGDNAGMIALVALDRYRQGKFFDLSADAYAHANLDEAY